MTTPDRDPPPSSQAPLWRHVVLLVVILAAIASLTDPTVATVDEGSYGLQADALAQGHWAYPWRFTEIDPEGEWFPLANSEGSGSSRYAYLKHPLVPTVLAHSGRVFGRDLGYLVPSLAGVVGTALVAWAVARRLRPGSEVLAFWLTATGPVLFNGFIIWPHAPAAALAGLAVLGAVRLRTERSPRSMVAAQLPVIAGLGGLVLVRSEGLLFGLALLLAMAVDAALAPGPNMGVGKTQPIWSAPSLVGFAMRIGPGLAGLGVARLVERAWITSVGGAAPQDLAVRSLDSDPGWFAGRAEGLWHSTLAGSIFGTRAVLLPALIALIAVAIAWRTRIRTPVVVPAALAVLATAMVLQMSAVPVDRITGLVAAWPLVVVGVVALGRLAWSRFGLLIISSGTFAGAVWATQYADGGAFQWGGRLLQPLVVPLAVIAADGLRVLLEEAYGSRRRLLGASMAALMLVGAAASMVSLRETRSHTGAAYEGLAEAVGPVAVATNGELPRLMWRYDIDWLHVDRPELPAAMGKLRSTDIEQVSVVSSSDIDDRDVAAFGRITNRHRAAGSGLLVVEVTRS